MFKSWKLMAVLLLAVAVSGCGGSDIELGEVTGTVYLDGKPLPRAAVVFVPTKPGRSAIGGTDENGVYEMKYTPTAIGSLVGEVTVEIRTGSPDNPKEFPERVPSKYNTRSELKAEVKSGDNVLDFHLESK
jgi:hypothetical protein